MTGRPIPGTTIGGFVEGYPAKTSGLKEGDRIVAVNGHAVKTWPELTGAFETAPAGELALSVERKTEVIHLRLAPKVEAVKDIFGASVEVKRLGITPHPEAYQIERYGFLEAAQRGLETEITLTRLTYKAILYLILGKLSIKTMSGPIGIIAMTGSAVKLGLPYLLQLTANLSISLAVINLLPIPALDGGHLLFLLIEGVSRRKVSLNVQERAAQVGFVLLLALMAFIIYNDLVTMNVFEKVRGLLGGFKI